MYFIKVILIITVTVFDSLKVLLMMAIKGREVFSGYSVKWSRKLLKIIGVDLIVNFAEKPDPEKSYIYVTNHSSLIDIPVLLASLPGDVRIIYKKELEKIPVFGYGLKKSPFIGINREDPRKAMKGIQNAVKMTDEGASIIIFPEGTRSETGELGEFKRGGFLLAEKAGKPIVPIAIKGTREIMPAGKLKFYPGKVELTAMTPIKLDGMGKDELKNLKALVREKIRKELEKS